MSEPKSVCVGCKHAAWSAAKDGRGVCDWEPESRPITGFWNAGRIYKRGTSTECGARVAIDVTSTETVPS